MKPFDKPAPKKRNPQDSTLTNVRAANKKFKDLKAQVETLVALYYNLADRVKKLEKKK